MKRALPIAAFAAGILMSAAGLAAPDYGTVEEARALVKKAVAHYEKVGAEKTFADLSRTPGPFVDRDLYVVVYDMNGKSLAHINPRMVGKDLIDMRDGDGRYLVKERVEAARKGTSGWQDIKFFNPVTKKVEPKRVYWERHGQLLFSSGAYKAQ
jgi:signal transduction histidine kinase